MDIREAYGLTEEEYRNLSVEEIDDFYYPDKEKKQLELLIGSDLLTEEEKEEAIEYISHKSSQKVRPLWEQLASLWAK